ncbi:hypothetical protein [Spirosoma sp.]|uniref:hypothetical protein n=1 Tax=Spirosoma sp. TaxID=1899569 RepID=UPI00260E7AAC|nr:hypothetical protein [Spirosoma sp.]MCX6218318.1 hypothetical protein [Spirosoma sp.]
MKQPTPEQMSIATPCRASWQIISTNGAAFTVRCRICKVYLVNGGTPMCLLPKQS